MASAYAVCQSDRRWFVSVDTWHHERTLVNAMIADLPHNHYTRIDGGDPASPEMWHRYGFELERRKIEFVLSLDPTRTGLRTLLPAGVGLLTADLIASPADHQTLNSRTAGWGRASGAADGRLAAGPVESVAWTASEANLIARSAIERVCGSVHAQDGVGRGFQPADPPRSAKA